MMRSPLPLLAVAGLLAAAAPARAEDVKPAVRDEAGLFSPAGVAEATAELGAVRMEYHLDFIIDTVAAPPDEVRKQLQSAKNNAARERILRDWAGERAEAAGGQAVYILVAKDVVRGWFGKPYGCVVVTVPQGARSAEFTEADAKSLHDRLVWFHSGQNTAHNDATLRAAVAKVRDELRYNLLPPFPWLQVGGVVLAVLCLGGGLCLARRGLSAADAPARPEPARLTLHAARLAGMFGAPAAYWIYDTLFVVASRAEAPVRAAATATATPADPPAEDGPPPTKAERLDLAARDEPAEAPDAAAAAPS